MVLAGRESEGRLPHNLHPHVESLGRFLPLTPVELRPFAQIRQKVAHSSSPDSTVHQHEANPSRIAQIIGEAILQRQEIPHRNSASMEPKDRKESAEHRTSELKTARAWEGYGHGAMTSAPGKNDPFVLT